VLGEISRIFNYHNYWTHCPVTPFGGPEIEGFILLQTELTLCIISAPLERHLSSAGSPIECDIYREIFPLKIPIAPIAMYFIACLCTSAYLTHDLPNFTSS